MVFENFFLKMIIDELIMIVGQRGRRVELMLT